MLLDFVKKINLFGILHVKIGRYFINTHFVYGDEKSAVQLLEFINQNLSDKQTLPKKIFDKVLKQYNENKIYKDVINTMKNYIEENIDVTKIDYISGGERRDWFFSNMIAYLLKKPHISIFKDLNTVVSDYNFENSITSKTDLEGKNVLHIADLITVASSYIRAWIPAIQNLGASIKWSCSVVDRMQGGKDKLKANNIESFSLVNVDESLFKKALELKIINENQFKMLNDFFKNPDETMKNFLIAHPEFLENALNSDEKTRSRAKLLVDGNLYGLD